MKIHFLNRKTEAQKHERSASVFSSKNIGRETENLLNENSLEANFKQHETFSALTSCWAQKHIKILIFSIFHPIRKRTLLSRKLERDDATVFLVCWKVVFQKSGKNEKVFYFHFSFVIFPFLEFVEHGEKKKQMKISR